MENLKGLADDYCLFQPFLLNFIIWMVILDMQFLWLYIDDLIKGLEWNIILELLTYASTIVL